MGKKFKHIEKKITLVGTIRKYSRPFFITTGLIFVVSIFWNYGTTFTKSTKISDEALQQQLEIAPSVVDGEAIDENSVSRLVGLKVQQWRVQNPSSAPGIMDMIQFRVESMDEIIERRVFLSEAKIQKIKIKDSSISERKERDLESFFINQDEEGNFFEKFKSRKEAKKAFFNRISSLGMSETDYLNLIEEDLMIEEIEVSISMTAQSDSETYKKDIENVIQNMIDEGKNLTEISLELNNGRPGLRSIASRWITRAEAESAMIPFEELNQQKIIKYQLGNETFFSIGLEYREASGQEYEEFVKTQKSKNNKELNLEQIAVETDYSKNYEAVRVQSIQVSAPLNELYNDIKNKITSSHEIVVNDKVYLIYRDLLLGNYDSSGSKSLESSQEENARNEYLALCAWSFLLKSKMSESEKDESSLLQSQSCSSDLLKLAPFDPYNILLLARIELETGNKTKAIKLIEEAKEFRGQNLNISFQISSLFREAGNEEMALLEDEERNQMIGNLNNKLF
ncbi:hypothetical protein CL645_05580 [bacterium]|nr:hypothetical protein [bacterium]|tara:strand:+ start:448 stop:1980 length:1533 start_codon:yes stop_codon:yes gene_type:complete